MSGPSIVGYGSYRWLKERSKDPRWSKFGKHKMGKACLYFKQFADLD
jgi:hypothetical protein